MVTQENASSQTKKLLLSKRAAAELLSLCARTVDYLVDEGELPVVRVGRRVLFRVRDLEVFAHRGSHRTGRGQLDAGPNGGVGAEQAAE
jgi:excisionase family DNA binding protein